MSCLCFVFSEGGGANIHLYAFVEGANVHPLYELGGRMSSRAVFRQGANVRGGKCPAPEQRATWKYLSMYNWQPELKTVIVTLFSSLGIALNCYFQSSGIVCNQFAISCPLTPYHFDTVLKVINVLTGFGVLIAPVPGHCLLIA